VISILKLTEDGFDIFFDEIGKEDQPDDDDEYTPTLRAIAILVYYLIINGRSKCNNVIHEKHVPFLIKLNRPRNA
jgi:hypothetical protein